ncbi:glycine zipper family protein [Candidatus Bathyarchaeota archaeon]|nr:glycine zipper family protein [Candidatus Bathyarchaeota archaeon]
MAEKKNNLSKWAGIGLVFGTAIGVSIFAFTNEPWHIGAGTGVGLVVGAAIGSLISKRARRDYIDRK